jgi:hypothetical protein
MYKCASNCKSKTSESFRMFKGIFTERLTSEGFVVNSSNVENPFEDLTENKRLMSTMKNFDIQTVPNLP